MRIAFTGSSGTGKTTLSNWVCEAYKLPYNTVGSRSTAAKLGLANPYDSDRTCLHCWEEYTELKLDFMPDTCEGHKFHSMRERFQQEMLNDKFAWEDEHKVRGFVTDRHYVDQWAYSSHHDQNMLKEGYISKVLNNSQAIGYDLVVHLPNAVFRARESDKARVPDPRYHARYDITLMEAHRLVGTNRLVSLKVADLDQRKKVLSVLFQALTPARDLKGLKELLSNIESNSDVKVQHQFSIVSWR